MLESAQTGRVADAYLDDDTIASERIALGAEARAALDLPKKTGDCVAVLMERIDHPRAITI